MKLEKLGALGAGVILAIACGGGTTDVGGVDGGGATDAGVGGSSGSSGSSASGGSGGGVGGSAGVGGSGGAGCPSDLGAAVGQPCSEEGKFCGGEGCDPCQFCNIIQCQGGVWKQMEVFPDPNCKDSGMQCGGEAGIPCPSDMWCDMELDGCFDDGLGVCVKKPDGCFADCPGVCGCDGKFYCNECTAQQAGQDISTSGACKEGDGGVGASCGGDGECKGGLKCCYPCGIPGCDNQCMAPGPNGQCPLFP